MISSVFVLLGSASGLRVTKLEPTDAHVHPTYTSAALKNLKRVNDILDEYINSYGTNHEEEDKPKSLNLHTPERLSMIESDGFFDEPDRLWTMRKQRHMHQMYMEKRLMKTCGDGVHCEGQAFWQVHYEPSLRCLAEERVANAGGDQWICDPSRLRAKQKCLVYSIGSHGQYDFEKGVNEKISPKCEIHSIDMEPWANYTDQAPPKYVSYHAKKIGPAPDMPIDALVRDLGHEGREIDILKMDCEGREWETYKSWVGPDVNIRQILVKLHGSNPGKEAHEFFNFFFGMGYVVFHKELVAEGSEYALVRLNPKFSRAEDADQ